MTEDSNMPGMGEGNDLTFRQALERKALLEYGTLGHTPEVITDTWQALWNAWKEKTGVTVTVPRPTKTHGEIMELENRERMLIYVPEELSKPDALSALQALLPKQTKPCYWAGKSSSITVENIDQHGWLSVEKAAWLSNNGAYIRGNETLTPAGQARKQGIEDGRLVGQTINTYVIGSLFNKLTTGYFFDEQWTGASNADTRKSSLLLGSKLGHTDEEDQRPRYVPYARAQMGDPYIFSPRNSRTLHDFVIWSYGHNVVDYDAVRTVELRPPTRQTNRR